MDIKEPNGVEPVLGKDELLEKAVDLAYLLTKRGGIKRVGIAGSLAREKENPSDIDFVIFLPQIDVLSYRIDTSIGKRIPWSDRIGLTDSSVKNSLKIILDFFSINGIKLDVHFLPDSFDRTTLDSMNELSGDPSYLLQIVEDLLIFDLSSERFIKQPVYSPDQIEQIRASCFESMKSAVDNKQRLDQIFEDLGSKKRRSNSSAKNCLINKFPQNQ